MFVAAFRIQRHTAGGAAATVDDDFFPAAHARLALGHDAALYAIVALGVADGHAAAAVATSGADDYATGVAAVSHYAKNALFAWFEVVALVLLRVVVVKHAVGALLLDGGAEASAPLHFWQDIDPAPDRHKGA